MGKSLKRQNKKMSKLVDRRNPRAEFQERDSIQQKAYTRKKKHKGKDRDFDPSF